MVTIQVIMLTVLVTCHQVRESLRGSGLILGSQLTSMLSMSSAFSIGRMFFTLQPILQECWRGMSRGNIPNFLNKL
jgi:hypothetical protein